MEINYLWLSSAHVGRLTFQPLFKPAGQKASFYHEAQRQEASAPVLAKLTRWCVMRFWNLLSSTDRGFPRAASNAPKKAMTSKRWKEKRLGNTSRSPDALMGPDGVWVTTYRYTGLLRAAADRKRKFKWFKQTLIGAGKWSCSVDSELELFSHQVQNCVFF